MKQYRHKYSYWIKLWDKVDWLRVYLDEDVVLSNKPHDKEVFYRTEINGDVTISINHKNPDHRARNQWIVNTLYAFMTTQPNYTYEIGFIVGIEQGSGVTIKYQGYFSATDGNCDIDSGSYRVKPQVNDKYRAVIDMKDQEYNILKVAASNSLIFRVRSRIVWGWEGPMYSTSSYFPVGHNHVATGQALLAREEIEIRPSSDPEGWTYDAGKGVYYRHWNIAYPDLQVYTTTTAVFPTPGGDPQPPFGDPNFHNGWSYLYRYSAGQTTYFWLINTRGVYYDTTFARGRRVETVIQWLLDKMNTGLTLKSEFFSANVNYVTGEANRLKDFIIAQKSDIKNPSATEAATKGITTFDKLMSWFRNMFDARWFIDKEGFFRIEHISVLTELEDGIDLTNADKYDPLCLSESNEFTFSKEVMPNKEKWEFMEAKNEDFVGLPIVYDGIATTQRDGDNSKIYDLKEITTDLDHILKNSKDISDEGFVFLVSNGLLPSDTMAEKGYLSDQFYPNAHLSLANLHNNYWRFERVLKTGTMNGETTEFESEIPKLKRKKITFSLHESDQFEPEKSIKTFFKQVNLDTYEYDDIIQFGKVLQADHDLNSDFVTVELIYRHEQAIEGMLEALFDLLPISVEETDQGAYLRINEVGSTGESPELNTKNDFKTATNKAVRKKNGKYGFNVTQE